MGTILTAQTKYSGLCPKYSSASTKTLQINFKRKPKFSKFLKYLELI